MSVYYLSGLLAGYMLAVLLTGLFLGTALVAWDWWQKEVRGNGW